MAHQYTPHQTADPAFRRIGNGGHRDLLHIKE